MGALRTVALVILGISGLTFIALFGRLPAFRKTPISFLHKVVWKYIPSGIAYCDDRLLGGRFLYRWNRASGYIFHENHPLVLIFFAALLIVGEFLFIPSAWPRISIVHRVCAPAVAVLPYIFLYASVISKSYITPENHAREMARYPYDNVVFHPGRHCRTCEFPKPARSKHCSYCKACVSRQDHHCVWLTNCVGTNNYHYFLSLLLSVSALLIYGSCLGYSLLSQTLNQLFPPGSGVQLSKQSWIMFFNVWSMVISYDIRIGMVTLLAFMTTPLALAFLVYHTYLIWAGMTTNESAKWATWRDEVSDGCVFKSTRGEIYGNSAVLGEGSKPQLSWPVSSDQILVLTDGHPPAEGYMLSSRSNEIVQPENRDAPVDSRWVRVRSMGDVDNIYDLGFWDNLREAFNLPIHKMRYT